MKAHTLIVGALATLTVCGAEEKHLDCPHWISVTPLIEGWTDACTLKTVVRTQQPAIFRWRTASEGGGWKPFPSKAKFVEYLDEVKTAERGGKAGAVDDAWDWIDGTKIPMEGHAFADVIAKALSLK